MFCRVVLALAASLPCQDPPNPDRGGTLLAEGQRQMQARDFASAEQTLTAAIRAFEDQAVHDGADFARFLTGQCLDEQSKFSAALAVFETVLANRTAALAGKDHANLLGILGWIGALHQRLGQYRQALPHYERAVEMAYRLQPDGKDDMVMRAVNNLGNCLEQLGRDDAALPRYETALAIAEALVEADPASKAILHDNIAVCLVALGRPEEARRHAETAQDIRERVDRGAHVDVARGLSNVGFVLSACGHKEQALDRYRASVAMFSALYDGDHELLARAMINVAGIHTDLDQHAEALARQREAHAMYARLFPGDHPDVALAGYHIGESLRRLGRTTEAREVLEQSLAMARRLESTHSRIIAAGLGGLLLQDLDQPARAIPLFDEAITRLESRRVATRGLDEGDRADYFRKLAGNGGFDGMVIAQIAVGDPVRAYTYAEQGKGRSLLDLLERGGLDPVAELRRTAAAASDRATLERLDAIEKRITGEFEAATWHERALARARQGGETPAELEQHTTAMRDARLGHQAAIRDRARLVADHVTVASPADLAATAAMLDDDDLLIQYYVTGAGSYALRVDAAGSVRGFTLRWPDGGGPVRREEIDAAVDRHHAAIATRAEPGHERGLRPLRGDVTRSDPHRLFRALVPGDLWVELQGATTVHIIPHWGLHRLPFETLVVAPPEDGRPLTYWLDAGPSITYGASATVQTFVDRRRRERSTATAARAVLAVGDPVFTTLGAADARTTAVERSSVAARHGVLTRLPGTRDEVLAIRRAFTGADVAVLLGADATEGALFERAPELRILHVATHGLADEGHNASFSSLALTPPKTPTPHDDGFLRLNDLLENWRGRLAACDLVVLSACDTQVGRLQYDEGIHALPVGFLYAGAASVVGSHWKVDDSSTATLMADFYRRLANGTPRLRALTEARRALRAQKPAPYYWAAFVFLGSPGATAK